MKYKIQRYRDGWVDFCETESLEYCEGFMRAVDLFSCHEAYRVIVTEQVLMELAEK